MAPIEAPTWQPWRSTAIMDVLSDEKPQEDIPAHKESSRDHSAEKRYVLQGVLRKPHEDHPSRWSAFKHSIPSKVSHFLWSHASHSFPAILNSV